MIKVLLVDEQYLMSCGLGLLLNEQEGIDVVGVAKNSLDAKNIIQETQPDVMLLGVGLRDQEGLSEIESLVQVDPNLKTLLVSQHGPVYVVARLLNIRAQGYLTQDTEFEEVIRAIQTVASGEEFVSSEVLNQLALRHVSEDKTPSFTKLSERESQIMDMVLQGYKVQDCAEKLDINPKTVNSYRYRIFSKLQATSDVELVLLAILYNLIDKKSFIKKLDFIK